MISCVLVTALILFFKENLIKVHVSFLIESLLNIIPVAMNVNMEVLIEFKDALEYPRLFSNCLS